MVSRQPEATVVSSSILSSLETRHFGRLWLSGFLWNVTRWMGLFISAYLVNDLTGSPLQVQLVGSAVFAPMLIGSALAGAIADRFDRRRTLITVLALLAAASAVMATIVLMGAVQGWMVYVYGATLGFGGVVDLTSRRPFIFDLVGEQRVTNALALESFGLSFGNVLGAGTGGAIIALLGIGQAFVAIAVCYVFATALMLSVAPVARLVAARAGTSSILQDLREGLRYVRGDRTQVSLMGVTVVVNLFFFSFVPIVPVIADDLGVGAFLAGVLGSGMGVGMLAGSIAIAARPQWHRGALFAGGSFVAIACLVPFAAFASYPVALIAIIAAGVGVVGFATMQSVLVMVIAGPALQSRAMGVMGMAIGALPIGMASLGFLAEGIGPRPALLLTLGLGMVALLAFLSWRPEAARVR